MIGDESVWKPVHNEPHIFIQWKNTDACFDFYCDCGWSGHFDGYFAYYIRCGGCGAIYRNQSDVHLYKLDAGESIRFDGDSFDAVVPKHHDTEV